MSALDLFASALGAFILIAVVLFPFFPNVSPSETQIAQMLEQLREARRELQECREDLAQNQAALRQSQAELQESQAALQQCNENLRKKFLLVVISWGSYDDVDLHIVDPRGNEFYYRAPSHRGSEAKLEEDNTRGPGNEIWLHPRATPGAYKVYYKLYEKRSAIASVRGSMLTPEGRQTIPSRTLILQGQKPLVAVITVDRNGNATLQSR